MFVWVVCYSMVEKETVQTEYGDVEIEVGECDQCGQKVRADKLYEYEIDMEDEVRSGKVCEFCASMPVTNLPLWKRIFVAGSMYEFFGAFATIVGFPLVVWLFFIDKEIEKEDKLFYIYSLLGLAVWLLLIAILGGVV